MSTSSAPFSIFEVALGLVVGVVEATPKVSEAILAAASMALRGGSLALVPASFCFSSGAGDSFSLPLSVADGEEDLALALDLGAARPCSTQRRSSDLSTRKLSSFISRANVIVSSALSR